MTQQTKVFVLKISSQNTDGSYDYVKVAGVFFKREDAIQKIHEKMGRMKLEWDNYKSAKYNEDLYFIHNNDLDIRKWYEIIETVVK